MGRIGNEKKSTPIKWCDVHGLVVLERYKRTVAAGCCQMGIRGQKNLEYTRARFWAQTPPPLSPWALMLSPWNVVKLCLYI